MSRLTRDGTAEPVSRDQILRHARGQGNINFPGSADHEQDWQPYPVDPYSAICDGHTYILLRHGCSINRRSCYACTAVLFVQIAHPVQCEAGSTSTKLSRVLRVELAHSSSARRYGSSLDHICLVGNQGNLENIVAIF